MKALLLAGLGAIGWTTSASAQTVDHSHHGAMHIPAAPASPPAEQTQSERVEDPHARHRMPEPPKADPHAGHHLSAPPVPVAMATGTDLPAGNAPPPAPKPGLAAARYWGAEAMAMANHHLRHHHGGMAFRQVMLNLAEVQVRDGRNGYRWDGEAWIGGDINRFTLKSEGEGAFGGRAEQVEVQALYSRAIDPYWNLQAGMRHDIRPGRSRSYATIGIEGLAPYWFQMEGAVFLSEKGDLLARAEGSYDQRLTQNLVLQPRVEANFSAQTVRATQLGAGVTDLELGLRVRYERQRAFAPYVGVSWERRLGDTARLARARGDGTGGFAFVAGVRTWF
ncbi:hypothetical protein ATB93_02805 [Sphingomonas sp. WG]|nr:MULTISPECIES: copper resistance protein B [unclassified Sphingomonas]KTF67668.1 hypothetical protein ATB93_02805 [Sphingomonas sp. WG]